MTPRFLILLLTDVAHALMRAASALVPTLGRPSPGPRFSRGAGFSLPRASARLLLYATLCSFTLAAQPGAISGTIHESAGRPLTQADLQLQNEATGARWKTSSEDSGRYSFPGLPPGPYKLTVRMPGFRTIVRSGIQVNAGQDVPADFQMEWLTLHEVITVSSGRSAVDPSAGDTLLVTRTGPGASLPAGSRDFRASFDLLPGVVVTPAGVSDAGQFTSNGQRPNASFFRIDGISANTGVGGSALPGSFPGASLPAMTAIGSTENLAAPETTQSIELRTAAFAPEFGDRPGAEALVTTRSGSNQFHGELFTHVRDTGWTARDWFANSRGLPFPRPYYRSVGAAGGGPIRRNRTFFFASIERSLVNFSGLQLTLVPSFAARRDAPPALQPVLNAFPLPTGPDFAGGTAEGSSAFTRVAHVSSTGLRLDQALGSRGNLFFRFVDSPSSSESIAFDVNGGKLHWTSATGGLTARLSSSLIEDLRLNYSRARLSTHLGNLWAPAFDLAGLSSVNPPPGIVPPEDSTGAIMGLSIPGLGQFVGGVLGSPRQDQFEIRQTLAKSTEAHDLRAGADYTRLEPSRDSGSVSILAQAASLQGVLSGDPLPVNYAIMSRHGGRIHTFSLFAQDTWHASARLSLVYGVRWELTPPTSPQIQVPSAAGIWQAGGWQFVQTGDIFGTAPWPMRFGQVAPRLGIAWRIPGSAFVFRAGGGVFFDTTLGASTNPINGAPFNSWQVPSSINGGVISISPAGSGGGSSLTPDVLQFLNGQVPSLHLPVSYQWRASLDRDLPRGGYLSAAWIGAAGRHLLSNAAYVDPNTGVLARFVTWTRDSSNYQALQMRYTGSLPGSVYGSLAYTWSHSIDDGSQDSSVFLIHPGYTPGEARGSSSFDVRQALTAALSYRVPRRLPNGLAGWTVSGILRLHTGFPIDILNGPQGLGRGFDNVGRPDLVLGVPIWWNDPSVAGHRRLNPAAFLAPPAGVVGTLGRNAITGNGLAQLDVSLRREFAIAGPVSLEAAVSIFNLLNHPAFADPVPYLSSPWFGQSTSMQNLMLGSGTPNSGLPPLFQSGGARSGQLSLRLFF